LNRDAETQKGPAMKHLEHLAQSRVNDALQAGLRNQAIHRALAEDAPAPAARPRRSFEWLAALAAFVGRLLRAEARTA
jgi:hypothetical protein